MFSDDIAKHMYGRIYMSSDLDGGNWEETRCSSLYWLKFKPLFHERRTEEACICDAAPNNLMMDVAE